MRTSIGTTWLMGLMITFILLFTAFIILTINYSKTMKVKNEMISMIEKYEGLNDTSIRLVNDYLINSGYMTKGVCTNANQKGVYGSVDLSSNNLVEAKAGSKYYYCVKKYAGANITNYYQVSVFYKFNLPIIGNTGGFVVRGTSTNFKSYDNSVYADVIS